jgi:hypothetical protein
MHRELSLPLDRGGVEAFGDHWQRIGQSIAGAELIIPHTRFERNVMTVSEYEERFRASAPSLRETFTGMRGPSRGRLRRRLWTAAVLAGAVIAAVEAASHHAADNFMASALKTWQPDAGAGKACSARGFLTRR